MVGGSEKEDRTVNTSFSLGVQLVLKRGATLPSSLNKLKKKIGAGAGTASVFVGDHVISSAIV